MFLLELLGMITSGMDRSARTLKKISTAEVTTLYFPKGFKGEFV